MRIYVRIAAVSAMALAGAMAFPAELLAQPTSTTQPSVLPAATVPAELRSRLDSSAPVTGFGTIRYREPLRGNFGPRVVLFQGIYGGSSHLSWRELLPRLDALGARVFVLDLPGTGESFSPERDYAAADIEDFVFRFVREVVGRPAILVGQSTASMFVLNAAKRLRGLNRGVVLISPTGVNNVASPPGPEQNAFFAQVRNNNAAGIAFYQSLLTLESIPRFVANGFYDPALVTDVFFQEYALQRDNLDQRWITFSFVGGQLFRSFQDASAGVRFPVLMLFGRDAQGVPDRNGNPGRTDREADFRALNPPANFRFQTVPRAGGLLWKEKPDLCAVEIVRFSRDARRAQIRGLLR